MKYKLREAFVTLVVGEEYLKYYNKFFRSSQEKFANKTGKELIVITDYIDISDYSKTRSPAWQKLLIFKAFQTKNFDRLCWIDADIYVTQNHQNPFLQVAEHEWGAVMNNPYNLDFLAASDLQMYEFCPQDNIPNYVINGGFVVVSKKYHANIMEYIYYNYKEKPETCYEQGYLSYHFINEYPGKILDVYFNNQIATYFMYEPYSFKNMFNLVKNHGCLHFSLSLKNDKKLILLIMFLDKINYYNSFLKKIVLILLKFMDKLNTFYSRKVFLGANPVTFQGVWEEKVVPISVEE